MSDLSSNSMSREELIRSARANCMRQIDEPQGKSIEEKGASAGQTAFKKSTYVRLFFSCSILLAVLAVKQFDLSYQGYSFSTIHKMVEDNRVFEKMEQVAAEKLEEDVLPVFARK